MMSKVKIFTIGFTKKTAAGFFELLRNSGTRRVVDVRLNNVSQLAGFTKKDDLQFFLKTVNGMDYIHLPELAPNKDLLDEYKKHHGDWSVYEKRFLSLMEIRHIENKVSKEVIDGGCLLCSESIPEHCHRRLVAEYLQSKWGHFEIVHL